MKEFISADLSTVLLAFALFHAASAIQCITCQKTLNVNIPGNFDCQNTSRLPPAAECQANLNTCFTLYTRTSGVELWARGCGTSLLPIPNSCDNHFNSPAAENEAVRCECDNEDGCNDFQLNQERLKCITCTKTYGVNKPARFDCEGTNPANLPQPHDCLPVQNVCYSRHSKTGLGNEAWTRGCAQLLNFTQTMNTCAVEKHPSEQVATCVCNSNGCNNGRTLFNGAGAVAVSRWLDVQVVTLLSIALFCL